MTRVEKARKASVEIIHAIEGVRIRGDYTPPELMVAEIAALHAAIRTSESAAPIPASVIRLEAQLRETLELGLAALQFADEGEGKAAS